MPKMHEGYPIAQSTEELSLATPVLLDRDLGHLWCKMASQRWLSNEIGLFTNVIIADRDWP
jgi:hypothetical protein